ncbi:MAG TPA: PH domain-containing protein [Nitrospiria bacterium]|jgi:hypothetical protein|nr:PH domain-containing protein [Nitrospiria bacterium]
MWPSTTVPSKFDAVKDKDEQIYWVGKPALIPFVATGIPILIVGMLWGAFDYFGIIRNMPGHMPGFAIPFFALHLFPFYGSVLYMAHLFLVRGNTFYAYTNKRLMMRSGVWGTDFNAIDYDKVSDIEVNVNPIENLFGVGTVRAFSGRVNDKGGRIYDSFIAISNPYEVFKKIKEVSVNIKTDWNYPNALRPEVNPGYQTKYSPKQ